MRARRIALAGVVAALVLAGCGGDGDGDDGSTDAPTAAGPVQVGDAMPAVSEDGTFSEACPEIETPAVQMGGHLVDDEPPPEPYTSVPPVSGWHDLEGPEAGRLYADLPDGQIISAVEAGIVVVAVAPDVDTTIAQDLLDQFPERLLVTTYAEPMPTPVALLTWGKIARCDSLTPWDITTFVLTERVPNLLEALEN